jgi:hypothetical protein
MKLDDEQIEALRDDLACYIQHGGLFNPELMDHDRVRDMLISCRRLATEVLETRALLASFDEDRLEEIITDSIDLDWTPRTAARAIVRAMKGASHE